MTLTKKPTTIGGINRGGLPWWFLQWFQGEKALILLPEEDGVMDLVDDLQALFKIPSGWGIPKEYSIYGYAAEDEPGRQVALYEWLFNKGRVLVTSHSGLNLACDNPDHLKQRSFRLRPGLIMNRNSFEDILSKGGYLRNDRTEQVGEYAIRGDVVDIWPPAYSHPIRITWNFDTVEALRTIDLHTQVSECFLTEIFLHPVTAGKVSSLAMMIPETTMVVTFSDQTPETINGFHVNPDNFFLVRASSDQNTNESIETYQYPPSFVGMMGGLREQLMKWQEEDWRVLIFCHNRGERDRLEELLGDPTAFAREVRPPWLPPFIIGELEHGFVNQTQRLAVLTNSEIFGRYRKRLRLPKFEEGMSLSSPLDISAHDYLVHEKYGIGRYLGLRSLKVGNVSSEFLVMEYKGGDKVYVPIFELQQVQKYLGAEGRRPALSSLDTAAWERIKSKVKEDVAKMAADLLRKAAERVIRPGHSFPVRTHLEEEFASSFLYKLTPDQLKTLEEVEVSMVSPKAMDRLICGDVGFGKTEIAMRAALKCALAGKQVALLCPTTILAEQHYRNFSERLADYPVTMSLLSRFQDKSNQKKIIENVAQGGVDIVIGTHRLLSSDVVFKNPGLLIIDEEHRFGVKQKHKLLSMRETVDVLSLTATPIPRTLASSLGGVKDLSVIETAPEGRLPISTHVGVFDEDLMVKAVQDELDRGGQIFYVHNHVKTLLARKEWLESVIPSVRIGMAHGQMKELELEKAMHNFLHKKKDLLLATTIIESGLDIPSVNTLIVEEAEEMGLAQLYQLRGRVGRSRAKAYCYLFYDSTNLTTDAKKRLEALKEFTSLGSGLRLAMRDMEIRGAGNLLGPQQHGNISAVGIETYSRLLNEEIQRLKGEAVDEYPEGPLLEISLSAYIPDDYMPAESERVLMYKRILSADKGHLIKLKEELVDRCGPLPSPSKTLFDAAALRLMAKEKGISEVHQESEAILVYFRNNVKLSEESFKILLAQPPSILTLIAGPPTGVRMFLQDNETPLDILGRFMRLVFPSVDRVEA